MGKPATRQQNKPSLMAAELAECQHRSLCRASAIITRLGDKASLRRERRGGAGEAGVTVISYCLTIKSQG